MATPAQQMLAAVRAGDAAMVAMLLDRDAQLADLADRGPDRFSVLHLAAIGNHLDVVELLLVAGATIDRYSHEGTTPLYEAALNGHLEVAQMLLAAGADTCLSDNGGYSILCAARRGGNQSLIALLQTCPQPGQTYARGYLHGRPRVT